jgi:iron complex outermembrane recepter protein
MRTLQSKQKCLASTIAAALALMAYTSAAHADKALEEVIVTAQKKDETLQTVPMTVNAVTAETIGKYSLLDFKDIQSITPGLTIKPQDSRTSTIAMRGVNVLTDTGYGPGVAIYWNEVNYDIDSAFSAMYDLGQVEVLRGPQGTLRGITAPAGAVTFVTKGPSFNELEGTIEQTFGERSLSNTQVGISFPIIEDVLAVRIAGLYDYNRDSGIKNVTTGQENSNLARSGRLTIAFRPTEDIEATLTHQYQETSNSGSDAIAGCGTGSRSDACFTPSDRNAVVAVKGDNAARRAITALRVEAHIDGYDFTSVTGYHDQIIQTHLGLDKGFINPAIGFGGLPTAQHIEPSIHTFTQELRLSSSEGEFYNWTYGLYGSKYKSNSDLRQTDATEYFSQDTTLLIPGDQEQYAVFTNQSFQFTDALEAQVGLRYQSQRVTQSMVGPTIVCGASFIPPFDLFPGGCLPSALVPPTQWPAEGGSAVAVDEGVTGSASISYQLTDDVRTYVTYGRSFRAGGFTVAPSTPGDLTEYEPETSDSIEIGIKSRLADGRIQLNGDVYYQKYHDFLARTQEAIVTASAPGVDNSETGGDFLNYNADAVVSGAELQLDALLTDDWQAGVGVSYTDAKFKDGQAYCNVRDDSGTIIPPSGINGDIVNTCDSAGRLSGEPNWGVTANTEYTIHWGPVDSYARLLYSFASGRSDDSAAGSVLDTSSYGVFNLFLGVRDEAKVWEISAWAKNLFDHEQVIKNTAPIQSSGVLSGYYGVQMIPERQLGITAKYNFSL